MIAERHRRVESLGFRLLVNKLDTAWGGTIDLYISDCSLAVSVSVSG